MHNSFLISGSGRSGTRFLANLMNLSETWTVLHEPHPKYIRNNTKENLEVVQKVFDRDFYGEVNSMRRYIFMDINVANHGVIIRNPFELWLSIANRKLSAKKKFNVVGGRKKRGVFGVETRIDDPETWITELDESLHIVDDAVQRGAYPIYFHRMTTDAKYTQKVIERFGIKDVEVTPELVKEKVNFTPNERSYNSIYDIPFNVVKVHQTCDWFYNKYLRGKI